jgi:hypothetical protein
LDDCASLEEEGLDERPIAALIHRILTTNPTDSTVDIQGLLIARHGRLVLEEYFYGFDKERPHDMRSAAKDVRSTSGWSGARARRKANA